MKTSVRSSISLAVFIGLVFLLPAPECPAAQPTLARLSFWLPPERMGEFERMYGETIVPILKTHGLAPSSRRGRATPDSIFSRLFEVATPSEVAVQSRLLQRDSTWTRVLRKVGAAFGAAGEDSLMQSRFELHSTPSGPGKRVKAGPGHRQNVWHTFAMPV